MNLEQWEKRASAGTSGDMVHNILADWQREIESRTLPPPDAALLAAAKRLACGCVDVIEWGTMGNEGPFADAVAQCLAAIAQAEAANER